MYWVIGFIGLLASLGLLGILNHLSFVVLTQTQNIIISFKDIKISRPGLWFPTIWIYLVPFSLATNFWEQSAFWIGLVFVTFPLNYLVYGLNDCNDIASDKVNDRKGNFLFGAKASQTHLDLVPKRIAIVLLPFLIYFTIQSGLAMLALLAFMILINIMYNFPPFRIKERPPFEILIQVGYVMTVIFSVLLNELEMIPWQTVLYLCLFAFQAHIAGEIMDIEPDILSNKKTTATIIGRKKTKYIMIFLLVIEVYILAVWFQDYILAGFLGLFSIWMVLDVFIFFKEKPYTLSQMKLFGLAMNVSAFGTMGWVLYSGELLHPMF